MSTDTPTPERDDLAQHFKECGCHDSWDQCPCADSGHPVDGSCGCCPRGDGLCGPTPERVTLTDEAAASNVCEPHHFVWTWPIEGGSGSVGVCSQCGSVTTGDRDTAREQALREEIAGEIEAVCEADEPPYYGCWYAARIARGDA